MLAEDLVPDYREALRKRLSTLPWRALAWLILAPEWPEELVALGFPSASNEDAQLEGRGAVAMLHEAAAGTRTPRMEGPRRAPRPPPPIVQASTALPPWEGDTFRIAPELRAVALELMIQPAIAEGSVANEPVGLEYVRRQLQQAAEVMQRSDKLQAYPPLWRWAQLAARAGSDEELHSFLDAQVRTEIEAAEQRDAVAAPDALRWIEAAEFFAEIFQGKLELSLTLARRRRELFNRRAYDRRKLVNYLPRPDQLQAFHDLLGDPDHWALHYIGDGGLGKTMLLRYITHHESRDPDGAVRMVTSRVDFDFLNPDYPFRAPGLLLAALAAELRLQAGNDATSIFISFENSINELHAAATSWPGEMRLVPLNDPRFTAAIDAFAAACLSLAFDGRSQEPRKVVLMLDTCEELAKLRPDGTVPDNVRVTFEILEQVRKRADNVRVVFSGRRALAGKGFGWASDSELPERGFLRLFPARGFSEQEARDLLTSFALDGKRVPDDFREPILNLTRYEDNDQDLRIRLDDALSRSGEVRHNPYDLDMYAEWVVANPSLTVKRLEDAGPHFYVEERIVGRLNSNVRKLLPQLAVLGRFDRVLLTALTASLANPAQLCEEVIGQEWLRADRADAGDRWLIEARLRDRILAFYRERQWPELEEARRRLASMLIQMTLERPLSELPIQYFSAAFEALHGDDAKAAWWWEQVEARILREEVWINWGQELAQHLLAEPNLGSDTTPSFRAAVLATQAAAIIHATGSGAGTLWQRAEAALPAYPTGVAGRARLEFRIQCGVQASFFQVADLTPLQHDAQCRASWLSALETLTERAEREGIRIDSPAQKSLDLLCSDPDAHLRSSALSLTARLVQLTQKEAGGVDGPAEAVKLFEDAVSNAAGLTRRQVFLDWRAPDHPAARAELELIRAVPARAPEVLARVASREIRNTVDEDRLWSALLQECEADSPAFARLSITDRPLCNAHRLYPPRAVTIAEKSARLHPLEQMQALRGYSVAAAAAGLADVSLMADRALTRVIRRQRMMSENWLIPSAMAQSADPYDVWLTAVTRALHTSGDSLKGILETLPAYVLPEVRPGTWKSAETALLRLDVAQLRDDAPVREFSSAAAEAMQAIGDEGGSFICAVSEADWRARTGKSLKSSVERLQALEPPDSSWADILAAAEKDDPAFLDALQPGWRPWIARALAVRTRAARPRAAQHPANIVKWLQANHAVEDNGVRFLPFELEFLKGTPSVVRGAAEFLGQVIGWGFVASCGAGFFWWIWDLSSRPSFSLDTTSGGNFWRVLWHNAVALSLHAGEVLLIVLALLIAMGAVGSLVEWLLKHFNIHGGTLYPLVIEYRIEAPGAVDRNRPMASAWKAEARQKIYFISGAWRPPRIARDARAFEELSRGEQSYRSLRNFLASERGPTRTAPSMAYALLRRSGIRMEIRISVDAGAAGGPWEAILGILRENEPISAIPSRFSRTVPHRAVLAQPDWESPVSATIWTYSGLGIDRANYSRVQGNSRGTSRMGSEILSRPSQYDEVRHRTGIAHIFGSPVERTAEVFLGVGGQERGDVPYWISPPEILHRYPNLRWLIVQAPPADIRERTSTDRLQAAQLKRFGARAFEVGIPAVLVLPALPRALIESSLRLVSEVIIGRGVNKSRDLIIMTRRLQDLVAASPHASADVPFELAFDICLYVEGRVNFRIRPERKAVPPEPVSSTDRSVT